MTDKELLELAAKAAGLPVDFACEGGIGWFALSRNAVGDVETWWNPLKDDGDALRLAMKLNLIVGAYGSYTSVGETYDKPKLSAAGEEFICWHHETHGDPRAATRRAIVRAAAEIGARITTEDGK